jgi:hypothetical protein
VFGRKKNGVELFCWIWSCLELSQTCPESRTLNCWIQVQVGSWVSVKGTYGAGARSFQGTFANLARKSACHVAGLSIGPIAWPTHGSPPNIAASSKLRVISPTGKWNMCVSGRHQSMNAAISGAS